MSLLSLGCIESPHTALTQRTLLLSILCGNPILQKCNADVFSLQTGYAVNR